VKRLLLGKKIENTRVGKDEEKLAVLCVISRNGKWYNWMENSMALPLKLHTGLGPWLSMKHSPSISKALGSTSTPAKKKKKNSTQNSRKIQHSQKRRNQRCQVLLFTAALSTVAKRKGKAHLKWMNKMWSMWK
jgi:hypothetical protein